MRNLKRALSLTLASVMLLGMMVVGASAVGYPDVTEEENVEAIEVLQAVQVMRGDDNGNFNPDSPVTRSEMAVVMALLLNLDYQYYEASCPFWDVPTWARPYVGACYANGIVSGYSANTYGAADTVTAVQAASMMMRALGYFKFSSDYKDGFETATVRQGTRIGIFTGVGSSAVEPMTRNQVAQMALNALKTPIVEPDDNTINIVDGNGNLVATGGQVNYVVVASSQSYARAIDATEVSGTGLNQVIGYTVELGEQLYNGKLELRDNNRDDFGRPARTWVNNGTEIGSYAKKELIVATYTDEVKGRTIYELLGQSAIRDNELFTYYDGADNSITKAQLTRSYDTGLANTGRGVLTEVYLDTDHDELSIVSINTWLAQASVDYNANSESITLTVYNGNNGSSISKRVDVEDAPFISTMKKDDWCLVQWADESTSHSQKTVVNAFDVEIHEDQKVTSFKRATESSVNLNDNEGKRVTEIITGGETIKNNAQAWYKYNTLNDFNASALVNKTYTVFLDQYGNFLGVDLYSGNDQYVFITGYDRNGSNISVNTAKASAIFTDGTMEAIDVNVKATNDNIDAWLNQTGHGTHTEYARWTSDKGSSTGSQDGNNLENMWYQYTEDRGVYTLTPVDGYTKDVNAITPSQDREVNSSNVYLSNSTYAASGSFGTGNSYGEDASIYITVDNGDVDTNIGGDSITEVTGVYTGAQDVNLVVPSGKWIHAVWKDNYIVAAIVFGDAEGTVENYAYIRNGIGREWIEEDGNGNRTHFWEFDAVMNGEKVTKTIKSRFSNTVNYLKPGQVQELIIDNDGFVTSIKDVSYPGNNVREDKLYNNSDFRTNTVNGTDTLKGNNVYHVETGLTTNTARQGGILMPTLDANGDTLLAFQGNTLRYSASDNDLALPVNRNAKAVVCQIINGNTTWENYSSVSSAYSILNDADGDSSTNVNGAKQFDGQIIAVLDSNGVAAWVVFIDDTPTSTINNNVNVNASNSIGNVDVYVRGTNVSITGRSIGATISRSGNLTVSIPVGNDVVSATASRITVTVDGVYRYDSAYTFDIVGNQAQYTLSGMDLDNSNDIVVTIYNFNAATRTPTSYDVDVVAGANGSASANVTTAAAGATVTVTATPDAGYAVDTVTTTPAVTVNGTGNTRTFTMPASDVTVNVTFKLDGVVDHYDYFQFMGQWFRIPMDANGNALGDPEECENPNVGGQAAFSMARAAVIPNGRLEAGGFYSFKLGSVDVTALWTGSRFVNMHFEGPVTSDALREGATQIGNTGDYILRVSEEKEIPAVKGEPAFTAGADGEANVADLDLGDVIVGGKLPAEILIDDTLTAEIEWTGDTNGNGIADEGETLTYTYTTVKAADDVTVTGDTEITVGDTTYVVPADTMNSEAGVAVDEDGVSGEDVTVKGDEPAPPTPAEDETCYAKFTGTEVELYVYGKDRPDNDKIIEAVLAAAGDETLTADDIVLTRTTVAIDDGAPQTLTQKELFKVTLPGGAVKYVADGEEVTGVTGVYYLLRNTLIETNTTASSGTAGEFTVANGKFTFYKDDESDKDKATYWDYTLVKALKVNQFSTDPTAEVYVADADAVDGSGWEELENLWNAQQNSRKDWYIQSGKALLIRATGGSNGESVSFVINDSQRANGTYDAAGNADIQVPSITAWDSDEPDTITIAKLGTMYTVKWNGVTVTNPNDPDGRWAENGAVTLPSPAEDGFWITGTSANNNNAVTFLPGGRTQFTLNSTVINSNAKDGVVEFNKAYEVKWTASGNTADKFAVQDPIHEEDQNEGVDLTGTATLVIAGYELEVKAADEYATLKPGDGSAWTLGTPTFGTDHKAVYTITLDKAIGDGEFVNKTVVSDTLSEDELKLVDSGETEGEVADEQVIADATSVTVSTGLTRNSVVNVQWYRPTTASSLAGLSIDWTIDTETKAVKISFINETGADITVRALNSDNDNGWAADTGTLRVTVDGITVDYTLEVTAASGN